jgi:Transposase
VQPGKLLRRVLAASIGVEDQPRFGRRRSIANRSASQIRSPRMWSAIAQPTTRRELRSITLARYIHPLPRPHARDDARPADVQLGGLELPPDHVPGGELSPGVGHGGPLPAPPVPALEVLLAHQPGHRLARAPRPRLAQRVVDAWGSVGLSRAIEGAEIPELHAFVSALRKDWAAVKAGLTLPWSSGRVEGHVYRIKMLKRQIYGRTNLDLLRRRVLAMS